MAGTLKKKLIGYKGNLRKISWKSKQTLFDVLVYNCGDIRNE